MYSHTRHIRKVVHEDMCLATIAIRVYIRILPVDGHINVHDRESSPRASSLADVTHGSFAVYVCILKYGVLVFMRAASCVSSYSDWLVRVTTLDESQPTLVKLYHAAMTRTRREPRDIRWARTRLGQWPDRCVRNSVGAVSTGQSGYSTVHRCRTGPSVLENAP